MSETDLSRLAKMLGANRSEDRAAEGEPGNAASARQFCGDIDMRIARDGTWFYHGSPIGRKPLVKLFASVLKRDEAGEYWLETPFEKCRIQVEDAPFNAVEMSVEGAGRGRRVGFRTNIDETVTVDADHPIRVAIDMETQEPAPYVLVRDGLEALIARAVFYDLVEMGETRRVAGNEVLGIWSSGAFYPLGSIEDG